LNVVYPVREVIRNLVEDFMEAAERLQQLLPGE
jgi:hypothetical protein